MNDGRKNNDAYTHRKHKLNRHKFRKRIRECVSEEVSCALLQRKKNFPNQIFFVWSLSCSERQRRRWCASFAMQLEAAAAVVVSQYESFHWRAFHMMLWVWEVSTILSSFIPYFYESGIFRVCKSTRTNIHTNTHTLLKNERIRFLASNSGALVHSTLDDCWRRVCHAYQTRGKNYRVHTNTTTYQSICYRQCRMKYISNRCFRCAAHAD